MCRPCPCGFRPCWDWWSSGYLLWNRYGIDTIKWRINKNERLFLLWKWREIKQPEWLRCANWTIPRCTWTVTRSIREDALWCLRTTRQSISSWPKRKTGDILQSWQRQPRLSGTCIILIKSIMHFWGRRAPCTCTRGSQIQGRTSVGRGVPWWCGESASLGGGISGDGKSAAGRDL